MSYSTWHNYGYGVCADDIGEATVEKLCFLVHVAPQLERKVQSYFRELDILEPTADDFFTAIEDEDFGCYGLATLIRLVIQETEGIILTVCNDFNDRKYLIYEPSYPWNMGKNDMQLTKEKLDTIYRKYIRILTDREINIDYQSVENGG